VKERSRLLDAPHERMTLQQLKDSDGSATANALDYSLNRWAALIRFADNGRPPVNNKWVADKIRPTATVQTSSTHTDWVRSDP
jgi:transposase